MAPERHDQPSDERYFALVRQFPLRLIRDDAELDGAIAIVDRLLVRPELAPAEEEYLAVLGRLIEDYDREHVILPDVSGVEILRYLMAEHDLAQSDLAELFGGKSVVSEMLSGKRRLALSHIRKLSQYFHVPADVFID